MKPHWLSWPCQGIGCNALILLLSSSLLAVPPQQQTPAKAEDSISGKVQKTDKDTRTITIQVRSNLVRPIVYTSTTAFTYGKKTASIDDVKNGKTLTCRGSFNEQRQFAARSCTIR